MNNGLKLRNYLPPVMRFEKNGHLFGKLKYLALPLLVMASIAVAIGPTGWKSVGEIIAGACRSVVTDIGAVDLAFVSAAMVLVGALTIGVWKSFRLSRELGQLTRELNRHAGPGSNREHAGYRFTVLADMVPFAFCHGLIKPRIYVSTSLVGLLTPDELAAVLAHERAHQVRRDPLRIAVAYVLLSALSILPGIGRIKNGYLLNLEIKADRVVKRDAGERQLRSALSKVLGAAEGRPISQPVSAFDHVAERIRALDADSQPGVLMLLSPSRGRAFVLFMWMGIIAGFWAYGVVSTATMLSAAPTCSPPVA